MTIHHFNGADGMSPIITGVGISFNQSTGISKGDSEDDSSSSEGKSSFPDIFDKIEKLKAKQLRNILIILFKSYGMKCTIEALVDKEAP